MTTEYVSPSGQGNVERTYAVPNIEEQRLHRIGLLGPRAGGGRTQVAYVILDRDKIEVNGHPVRSDDLVEFCDAILAQFTGEQLARYRRYR